MKFTQEIVQSKWRRFIKQESTLASTFLIFIQILGEGPMGSPLGSSHDGNDECLGVGFGSMVEQRIDAKQRLIESAQVGTFNEQRRNGSQVCC